MSFGNPEAAADMANVMFRTWTDFLTNMGKAWGANPLEDTPTDAARRARAALFKTWAGWWDQFSRTNEFMEAIKQGLNSSVQAQNQVNDFLTQSHHRMQLPAAEDIHELMREMRHLGRKLSRDTEMICERLEDLSADMARLQEQVGRETRSGESGNGAPRPRRCKRRPAPE